MTFFWFLVIGFFIPIKISLLFIWGIIYFCTMDVFFHRTDQRVLVLTLKFLALRKTGFPPVKNTSQKPQKLLIIGPKLFYHSTGPAAQTSPEFIFHIINMSQDSFISLSVVSSDSWTNPIRTNYNMHTTVATTNEEYICTN